MNHTSSQPSRKASQSRGECHSTNPVQSAADSVLPTQGKYQTIQLGVDTHGGQFTFARMIDNQGCQPTQKLSPPAFVDFLGKQKTLADRVVMVYEAGPYGYALYRQATELGVECLVCAPERLSRGRKRVNDKIDAKELLSRLDRHQAGTKTALRIITVPTVDQEMKRRLGRERDTYRKERGRWRGRGRSMFHTLGISRPGKWWIQTRRTELLEVVQQRYGQQVRDQIIAEAERYLEVMQVVETKLEELTTALREAGKKNAHIRIKGMGHLSMEILDREIVDWNRFKNRRQIGSFTGLCPGEDSSGDSRMMLSIDKCGNPRVRAILTELAWLLPRWQPTYKRLKRWAWVFAPGKKVSTSAKKKAVTALARQLAVDLWRIRTNRMKAEEMGLKLAA